MARHKKMLPSVDEILEFVTGGKAVFTIKNSATGGRATYRVEAAGEGAERTYAVLAFTGSDNTKRGSFTLMGVMDCDGGWAPRSALTQLQELRAAAVSANDSWLIRFVDSYINWNRRGQAVTSRMAEVLEKNLKRHKVLGYITNQTQLVAFPWLWDRLTHTDTMPPSIEVWHEGSCACCARSLTVPASIELGLGPDCAKNLGRFDKWKALNTLLGRDLEAYGEKLASEAPLLAA